MPRHRLLAYAFALWSAVSSYFLYKEYVYFNGFPDGGTTDLSNAKETIFTWFIAESLLLGVAFLYLGSRAGKTKHVNTLILLYILSVVAVVGIVAYLGMRLENGQRG